MNAYRKACARAAEIMLAAAAAAWLAACILEKDPGPGEGPSTETGNPNLSGILVDGGMPATGAVKLYRLPPAPAAGAVDSTPLIKPVLVGIDSVAADGRFRFDSLPPARYALEGVDAAGRKFALLPGLVLGTAKDTLKRDLGLQLPARIRGKVTRGPNARPSGIINNEKILVRIGGADRSAVADTAGAFAIENVPVGTYRMAFAASDGHYLTAYLDPVAAAAGADLALPQVDLEWSRFVAPPAVAGIAIARDSAANVVALTWRPVILSGGAAVLYRITRYDAGNDVLTTLQTPDSAVADSLRAIPKGSVLRYTVQAINPLGQAGPIDTLPPIIAPGRDSVVPGAAYLAGVVGSKGIPLVGAVVRLYAIPAHPGSPDSLPLAALLRDSLAADAAGRFRFDSLPAGRYTVTAQKPGAIEIAIRLGIELQSAGITLDTMEPQAPGSVSGAASRDSLWVSAPFKGDENIRVSLAGTPFAGLTDYGFAPAGGPFGLKNIPPGAYQLVVYATPEGYFLPDTLSVTVTPGLTLKIPSVIKARYNPSAPPPKIASLRVTASTRNRINLVWTPVARYAPLKGYRVLRLGADLAVLDSSQVLGVAAYADDVSKLAPGTKLNYVVRVVNDAGREGENGGDASGAPVTLTVPAGP